MADRRVADRRGRTSLQKAMWMLVAATAVLYVIAACVGAASYLANRARIEDNQAVIAEIQASNVKACKVAYQSIIDVFEPFFPPEPRTDKQQADLDKFKATVERYVRRCSKMEGEA